MTHLGSYPLDSIITGDARELAKAIPDESVDLIFTDPVYDRIDDYRWLAETAVRVLKPGGACLAWSNGKWHRTNANWLEAGGLVYRWDFACIAFGGAAPMNGKIIAKTNRVIWMDTSGASEMVGYLPDGYASVTDHTLLGNWSWSKSPKFTMSVLQAFASAIVFDPFCGQGTVPAVCKMMGNRRWISFEIDPDTAERARQRVAMTQPPLAFPEPEQIEMELAT